MHLDTIGLVAGVLTTSAWLPQLLRTWQARSADGLSWPYLAILSSGIALWITYGVLTANAPVVIANSVTFTLVSAVVGIKASAGRRARIVEMANADMPSTLPGQPALVRCRAAGSAWTTPRRDLSVPVRPAHATCETSPAERAPFTARSATNRASSPAQIRR